MPRKISIMLPDRFIEMIFCFLFAFLARDNFAQQIADTSYSPWIADPAYTVDMGPEVYIDAGHYNFHTKSGRYQSFAHLLERDGYEVRGYEGQFHKEGLIPAKILVISNALNEMNVQNWYVPVPSAFSAEEIEQVRQWVDQGGSLFLIADHMPMGGAAKELAAAFGFEFTNGFAMDTTRRGPAIFTLQEGDLAYNIITTGRKKSEAVNTVASFTGQAFKIPDDAISILQFNEHFVNFLPDTAWLFSENTPRIPAKGWSQGAFKKYGKGRVVVFGEAAMFTAQLAGPQQQKMGMNHPVAKQNYQLLLNIIHWLDGQID